VNAPTNEELMAAVRDGDLSRLALLFERHHRSLFRFFYRLTQRQGLSEDLVQEVFLRMLKYRQSFRENYPFTAWMYQIARNAFRDGAPKAAEEPLEQAALHVSSRLQSDVEDQIHEAQQTELLRRALAELPEDKRQVLILSRYQELSYEEIGMILDCEVNTVKSRVFRSVKLLAKVYQRLLEGRPA
jgi:RNA polymerase sigma factor (sigma-70 family)